MLGAVLYLHHNGVVHRDIKVRGHAPPAARLPRGGGVGSERGRGATSRRHATPPPLQVENFMFDWPGKDAQLKLCDFGFAAHVTPDHQVINRLCARAQSPGRGPQVSRLAVHITL